MSTVTVEELVRDPLALVKRAEAGESIVVTRDAQPVAELRPTLPAAPLPLRPYGLAKGQIVIPDDFDDPLPEEILRDFEGRSDDDSPLNDKQPDTGR